MEIHRFRPRLVDAVRGYYLPRLGHDIGAGVTVDRLVARLVGARSI